MVARPANPMRQSSANTTPMARRGPNTFDGNSGMKCAMASSSWFTLSTKRFLKAPVGVSMMVPMGTRSIFSAICSRMVRRALNATRWLIMDERQVRKNRAVCARAAAAASHAARSSVSVPSTSPAASSAMTR